VNFITLGIAKFVTTRQNAPVADSYAWKNSNWRADAYPPREELLAEIPSAMRKDLKRRGYIAAAILPFIFFAMDCFSTVFKDGAWNGTIDAFTLAFNVLASLLAAALFSTLAIEIPLNRELRFRRKQGRWRWE
jgi:hypothetical protein